MTKHYSLLKAYVAEVAKDVIGRSSTRRMNGATFRDAFSSEWTTILREIEGDFRALVRDMGVSLASAGIVSVEEQTKRAVEARFGPGASAVASMLFDALRQSAQKPGK